MSIKLVGKLPGGDRDGLQIAEGMLRDERRPVTVVAVLYPRQVAEVLDHPEDPVVVTCGVLKVEALLGDQDREGRELLARATKLRMGQEEPLPFGEDDDG